MTPQKQKPICVDVLRMASVRRQNSLGWVPMVIVSFAVLLTLGACTKRPSNANWQKAGVNQEQKARELGECRRFARRETEREAGIPPTASSTDPLSGTQGYDRLTSSYDLGKFQDRMFARCMQQLGYRLISKKKS